MVLVIFYLEECLVKSRTLNMILDNNNFRITNINDKTCEVTLMVKTISICNEKGGSGKTRLTLELAYMLSEKQKTLVLDLDPQASTTKQITGHAAHELTLADVISGNTTASEATIKAEGGWEGGLYIIPGDASVKFIEPIIKERKISPAEITLKKLLSATFNYFDYVIIDTPPDLGLLTSMALTASTHYIVPAEICQLHYEGWYEITQLANSLKEYLNPNLKYIGLVATRTAKMNAKVNIKNYAQFDKEAKIIGKIRDTVAIKDALDKKQPVSSVKNEAVYDDLKSIKDKVLGVLNGKSC